MNTKTKWDRKYQTRINENIDPEVNPRLAYLTPYLTGGKALELACGLGANSLFLANHYQVEAVDISEVAINYLKDKVSRTTLPINARVADLTDMGNLYWKKDIFDLVVITYYLDHSLFPLVKECIKERGYFFMETYYLSNTGTKEEISSHYKLKPQELLSEFKDWNILFFEEQQQEGRQTIFCQKRTT
jgi:tellurite methyltransferase